MNSQNLVNHSVRKPKLILIDGYGFLFRAYHSLPPLTSPDGRPVGAVYGFVNMLLKFISNHQSDYLAVVFDAGKKTFRHEIFEAYKANRPPAPDDLIPQFPLVREAVEALNIAAVEKQGFEADDLIATYTRVACEQGMDVVIASSDKDLMQLVSEHVVLFDPLKSKVIDRNVVFEKYGVYPERMKDLLSLMGDSSDNIPGVPGIGPKTAAQLLAEYGDLDAVLNRASEIKQQKRRESLIENREKALLSRELVSLCMDVTLDVSIESMVPKQPDEVMLRTFMANQGFKSLAEKLHLNKNTTNAPTTNTPKPAEHTNIAHVSRVYVQPQAIAIKQERLETVEQLHQWLAQLGEIAHLAIYWLWDKKTNTLLGASLATNTGNVASLLLVNQQQEGQADLFVQASTPKAVELRKALAFLKPFLQRTDILKIGFDVKAWLHILAMQSDKHISLEAWDDVMLMSYVLRAGSMDQNLVQLAQYYLQEAVSDDEFSYSKKTTEDDIHQHMIQSVQHVLALHHTLKGMLFKEHMLTVYERMEKSLTHVLMRMECHGIKVNATMLTDLSASFAHEIGQLEKEIFLLAGTEFNIGSPKQMGEVLFDRLGLAGGKKSKKTGSYSTGAEVLDDLASQGVEIAERILQWRSYSKLKSTYSDALAKQIASDGRVHTHFSMASVNTGRLSSRDPNLQNIPIRTELGNKIREVFIAERGCKLISADYSQIELRLLSHVAQIDVLKQAFREGKDIHAATASQIFEIPLDEVSDEQRRKAKMINFGIIYGMSGFGLAKRLGISREEAGKYIEKYFRQYPGIGHYMEETKIFAREHGYVTTLFGRKCYIRGINDRNHAIKQFSERAAINAPLQGAAADIIKLAMIQLDGVLRAKHPDTKLLLQVHDELVLECPDFKALEIQALVKNIMEHVVTISVPLTVSAQVGDNWREIH